MKLGVDVYSLRLQGWNIWQQMDYTHDIGLDLLHTGLSALESLEPAYLARVRERAQALNLDLEVGMGCICPTSDTFARSGTGLPFPRNSTDHAQVVVDHLRQLLPIAHAVGSASVHCYLGHKGDRLSELPIEAHMESIIQVLRQVRNLALDLGIIIAIENHAGDLLGREVKALVEEAGSDYVGVCFDSGGTLAAAAESPFVTLDYLAPYVVQSHIRDSALWEHPRGAAIQHVVMGQGSINIDEWARRFIAECPRASFTLENITGYPPRVMNYLEAEFWQAYPNSQIVDFIRFLELVRKGAPYMGAMITTEGGWRAEEMPVEYYAAQKLQQRLDLEQSVRYCQEVLGLGERGR